MSRSPLKLIKDLDNFKFVYYWACPDQGKVSPNLPTLLHAGEWIIEHNTSNYVGTERRKTMVDRRKKQAAATTAEMELVYSRRLNPEGRRVTDKVPVIDLDLTPEKFNEMKQDILN
ncbi:hypothetical protein ACMXYN_10765 [Neptuniibacter sp. PT8_73]|uniref:hypothetical protein n=1 Tax=unclassified Neptuniibacter TaxID=2630693 RepID=UPI0039F700AA